MALATRVTSLSGRSGASTRSRERRSDRNQPRNGRRRASSVTAPVHRTADWLATTAGVHENGGPGQRDPGRRRREGPAALVDDRLEHERLQLALEAGKLGTWTWDMAAGRTKWDERLEEMNGMAPGSFGGTFDDWQASIHPADRAECVARVQRAWPIPGRTCCSTAPSGPTARSTGSSVAAACSPTSRARRSAPRGRARRHRSRGARGGARPAGRRGPPAHPERAARAAAGAHAPGRRASSSRRATKPHPVRPSAATGTRSCRCVAVASASPSATSPATASRRSRRWRTSASACARCRTCTTTPPRCWPSSASSCACSHPTRWSPRSTGRSTRTPGASTTRWPATSRPRSAAPAPASWSRCGPIRRSVSARSTSGRRSRSGRDQTLVAFTDGILERRAEPITISLQRLVATCASGPRQPDALCEHLMHEMLVDLANDDDAAVVAVRRTP